LVKSKRSDHKIYIEIFNAVNKLTGMIMHFVHLHVLVLKFWCSYNRLFG